MENQTLTDDQKAKMKDLLWKFIRRALLTGLKLGTLSLVSNVLIELANVFFIQNKGFVFCSMACSTFLIFRHFRLSSLKEDAMFEEERKKILES